MIKIENVVTPSPEQWMAIIMGCRNPLNSWHLSDSYDAVDCNKCGRVYEDGGCSAEGRDCSPWRTIHIGEKDYSLMMRLRNAGTDHRKFMRMITVYADITAPLYWFKEEDTYKVGTVANSCSTMHKIAAKEFTLDDFSHEHLISTCSLESVINELNIYRDIYNHYDEQTEEYKAEFSKKDIWWQMIQLLPSSYNQKRTVMLNYETLTNMYHSRRNHRLDEWLVFCDWIESLPFSKLIIGDSIPYTRTAAVSSSKEVSQQTLQEA